jgi:mono/diheme cytochrome c family protein
LADEAIARGPAIVDAPGVWELWPALVVTRAVPSILPEPRSGPSPETGRIIFHSFLIADSLFARNSRLPLALDSRVAAVRVLAAEPRPIDLVEPLAPNALPIQRRVVEAPLEADGSIAVDVPADTPLRYQSLDADGLALNAALWYQAVRPGHLINQNTPTRFFDGFCGGCHGPRNAPAQEPVTLDVVSGASLSVASIQGPGDAIRDGQPDLLGFEEDVWTILESRCTECHGSSGGEGGLSLDPATAFETLLEPREGADGAWSYVDSAPGFARRSYLMEVLYERELDSLRALPEDAHPATELSPEELKRIALWIDLGASRSRSYR